MSAETFALLGVVLGALLAGGGNLLLAWREETMQGRAGVHLIRVTLERALTEVGRLERADRPAWGQQLPRSDAWEPYRSAVSARLPLDTLQRVDRAMQTLDRLNAAAARAFEREDRREHAIWEAEADSDLDKMRRLQEAPDLLILSRAAIGALPAARKDFEKALEVLRESATVRPVGRRRNISDLPPWARWHWRSLAVLTALGIVLGVTAVDLALRPEPEVDRVQRALAGHLSNEALTSCDAVKDHPNRFSCIVVENAAGTSCQRGTAARGARDLVAGPPSPVIAVAPECDKLTTAAEFSAARQNREDCLAFVEDAEAAVPSAKEQAKPGFLERLREKLRKGRAEPSTVPPVVAPDAAFVAGC